MLLPWISWVLCRLASRKQDPGCGQWWLGKRLEAGETGLHFAEVLSRIGWAAGLGLVRPILAGEMRVRTRRRILLRRRIHLCPQLQGGFEQVSMGNDPGQVELDAQLVLQDCLGLGRHPLKGWKRRTALLLPLKSPEAQPMQAASLDLQEDLRVGQRNETERIFTRDYAPGDRLRDLDWKALAKLGNLITRIPPESPRQSPWIRVLVLISPIEAPGRRPHDYALPLRSLKTLVRSVLEPMFQSSACLRIVLNFNEYRVESEQGWEAYLEALSVADLDDPGHLPDIGPDDLVFAFPWDRWAHRAVLASGNADAEGRFYWARTSGDPARQEESAPGPWPKDREET